MKTSNFSIDTKTTVSLTELKSLMTGNTCNGLTELKENEKLFGTDLIGSLIYKVSLYTNEKGLNVYVQKPKVGYGRENKKQVVYNKGFRLGTITFA